MAEWREPDSEVGRTGTSSADGSAAPADHRDDVGGDVDGRARDGYDGVDLFKSGSDEQEATYPGGDDGSGYYAESAAGSTAVEPTSQDSADADEMGRRGSLSVKDKVIEKMATRAALDVRGVARHGSGFDRLTGRELPRVHVRVAGGHVRVSLDIAVTWPEPLDEVGSNVRSEVRTHLTHLSGLEVDAVDVRIPTIVTPSVDEAPARRVQ